MVFMTFHFCAWMCKMYRTWFLNEWFLWAGSFYWIKIKPGPVESDSRTNCSIESDLFKWLELVFSLNSFTSSYLVLITFFFLQIKTCLLVFPSKSCMKQRVTLWPARQTRVRCTEANWLKQRITWTARYCWITIHSWCIVSTLSKHLL